MKFTTLNHSVEIEYDNNVWKASVGFQGSLVTFWALEKNEGESIPMLSVFEHPDNPISLEQIMENTIDQISKMLDNFHYEVIGKDEVRIEFIYSGLVSGTNLNFYQKIEKGKQIYSITYGCDSVQYKLYREEFCALLNGIKCEQGAR